MRKFHLALAGILCFLCFLGGSPEAAAGTNLNKVDVKRIPEWPIRSADVGGTLLFSDSPEVVERDGILYEDTVQGDVRLLYYHLNGTVKEKKVVVVVENETDEMAEVSISNYAMGGPSEDYLHVGKTTQKEYFAKKNAGYCFVAAHSKKLLSPKFSRVIVKPEKLVYGVFDFTTKIPVKVSVMMMPANADPLKFIETAKVLPADRSRLRGTFTGMNRVIKAEKPYNGRKDGIVAVTLADGVLDRYRTGIDATDGSLVENYGNYGVLYKISLPVSGYGRTRYYLNPRGGVYAGALSVSSGKYEKIEEMVETPRNLPYFGDGRRITDTSYIGEYDASEEVWFEFSPPGASNLPARIILAPVD